MKLSKFPMPPTSNKLYSSFRGRLVKSQVGRQFEDKVDFYKMVYKTNIERIKKELIGYNGELKVTCYFIFHKKKVYTLKNTLKKIDQTNRIKQVHDALSKILEIDDCRFTNTPTEKIYCQSINDEQVIITIEKTTIRDLGDLDV